jgi:hypothetical protein
MKAPSQNEFDMGNDKRGQGRAPRSSDASSPVLFGGYRLEMPPVRMGSFGTSKSVSTRKPGRFQCLTNVWVSRGVWDFVLALGTVWVYATITVAGMGIALLGHFHWPFRLQSCRPTSLEKPATMG